METQAAIEAMDRAIEDEEETRRDSGQKTEQ